MASSFRVHLPKCKSPSLEAATWGNPAWPLPKKVPQAELQHMVTILIHTTRDNDRFVAFVTVERAARMDQVRST
jgi:hypothetical protein